MKKLLVFFVSLMALATMVSAADLRVRAVHLSPDAPAVDVWVNGAKAIEDLDFQQTSDYAHLYEGMYNFQVTPTGLTSPVVIDADLNLERNRDYTILATGALGSITPIVLEDWSNLYNRYMAKLRFVHASPDAPAVDITTADGRVLVSKFEFRESTDYFRLAPGPYDLEVRLAGTDTVVLDIPVLELKKGHVYTAIASGFVSDNTLGPVLIDDRNGVTIMQNMKEDTTKDYYMGDEMKQGNHLEEDMMEQDMMQDDMMQ